MRDETARSPADRDDDHWDGSYGSDSGSYGSDDPASINRTRHD